MSRDEKSSAGEQGILFPRTESGDRSTTFTGKRVIAAALGTLDEGAAAAALAEDNWRSNYTEHFYNLVKMALQSPKGAVESAQAGLADLYGRFEFARDGQVTPLSALATWPAEQNFHTARVDGRAEAVRGLLIPYEDSILSDKSLSNQITLWQENGIIEPSHGQALEAVAANPQWLDLSGQTFVLLGAGAEMGPLDLLLSWGATVVAVDLPRQELWQRLIAKARNSAGSLIFPLRVPYSANMGDEQLAAQAGVDLLTETPEIIAWLRQFEGPLTVGGYAYLDGQLHVRVVLAMDAVMAALIRERDDVSLAFLATPTDVFAIPEEAAQIAQERYEQRSAERLYQDPLRVLSGGRFFRPNLQELVTVPSGKTFGLVDCLVTQQGPNYALAKRIQQWRAMVGRSKGVRVSANVAPATTTYSVIKNIALAAAYAGAEHFGVEIFEPQTSNTVMAAQLIYDLNQEDGAANPATDLDSPLELFMRGANHGGLWRAAFAGRSVLEIAALLGWREARSKGQQ